MPRLVTYNIAINRLSYEYDAISSQFIHLFITANTDFLVHCFRLLLSFHFDFQRGDLFLTLPRFLKCIMFLSLLLTPTINECIPLVFLHIPLGRDSRHLCPSPKDLCQILTPQAYHY